MAKKDRLMETLENSMMYEVEFNVHVEENRLRVTIRCSDGERLSFVPDATTVKFIIDYIRSIWVNITTYTKCKDGVLTYTHSDGRYD